jgi:hypothetical protein
LGHVRNIGEPQVNTGYFLLVRALDLTRLTTE